MKRSLLFALVLLLPTAAGARPLSEAPVELRALVDAELAFEAASSEQGMREAFLANLAHEGVIFRPGPVNGPEWMRDWEGTTGRLSWTPIHAEVSRDGAFGFTTGPWEYRATPEAESPVQTGYYLSVWHRAEDGWKVLGDIGTVGPLPEAPEAGEMTWPEMRETAVEGPADLDLDTELEGLLALDAQLSDAVFEDGLDALFEHATDDIRFNRINDPLLVGKEEAREAMAVLLIHPTWEPVGGRVAASGDLAFTYGLTHPSERALGKPTDPEGSYLRVWRRDAEGQWRVAADIMIPFSRG